MRKAFIFMIDAFMALMLAVFFVSIIDKYTPSNDLIIENTLYNYGDSLMNVLLTTYINQTQGSRNYSIPLVFSSEDDISRVASIIPDKYYVEVSIYDGNSWINKYKHELNSDPEHKISLISVVPIVLKPEDLSEPYGYGSFCKSNYDICTSSLNRHEGNIIGDLSNSFVRIVVGI